eukprot:1211189-Pyramimonas_sp.AAC.1
MIKTPDFSNVCERTIPGKSMNVRWDGPRAQPHSELMIWYFVHPSTPYFTQVAKKEAPPVLSNLERLKLLSTIEKAGLLSLGTLP